MPDIRPYVAVDLDGTLAHYDIHRGSTHIGAPIPLMVDRVKRWLAAGVEVRIFTARAYPLIFVGPDFSDEEIVALRCAGSAIPVDVIPTVLAIRRWCSVYVGEVLGITCAKDRACIEIFDDRAIQIIANTGMRADGRP